MTPFNLSIVLYLRVTFCVQLLFFCSVSAAADALEAPVLAEFSPEIYVRTHLRSDPDESSFGLGAILVFKNGMGKEVTGWSEFSSPIGMIIIKFEQLSGGKAYVIDETSWQPRVVTSSVASSQGLAVSGCKIADSTSTVPAGGAAVVGAGSTFVTPKMKKDPLPLEVGQKYPNTVSEDGNYVFSFIHAETKTLIGQIFFTVEGLANDDPIVNSRTVLLIEKR